MFYTSIFVMVIGISLGVLSFAIMKGKVMRSYGKISLILAFVLFIGALILVRIGLRLTLLNN